MTTIAVHPSGARLWLAGARPRTLPAAIVPVAVGTAVAASSVDVMWWRALLALVVGLGMQVGVNYANDYSDGVRGTDDRRVGPLRLVASGLATPPKVKRAAFASFGVAGLAGLGLAIVTNVWLLAVGVLCVLAAWFYTGGSKPYGYRGLGELSVFVFFGLVAVCGSQYVQEDSVTTTGVLAATAVGMLAVALLVVNNLRDRANDEQVGKVTLAVRLGDKNTRKLYALCVVVPFVLAGVIALNNINVLIVLGAAPLAFLVIRPVLGGASGRDLIITLQGTARLQLAFGALFALGLL